MSNAVSKFALVLLLLPASGFTHATMELNNVIFHCEPGESARQDVEVFNSGEDTISGPVKLAGQSAGHIDL
jgi:hypothetical protein